MNDNATRGLRWQRLVAEYLAPRLGGNPDDWGEANRVVAVEELSARYLKVLSTISREVPNP